MLASITTGPIQPFFTGKEMEAQAGIRAGKSFGEDQTQLPPWQMRYREGKLLLQSHRFKSGWT